MPPRAMTQAAIEKLVSDRVAATLAQDRATRGNTNGAGGPGDNIGGNAKGQGGAPPARECTYSSFMKCNPTSFHGNEVLLSYAVGSRKRKVFSASANVQRETRVKRKGFDGDLKMKMVVFCCWGCEQEEEKERDSVLLVLSVCSSGQLAGFVSDSMREICLFLQKKESGVAVGKRGLSRFQETRLQRECRGSKRKRDEHNRLSESCVGSLDVLKNAIENFVRVFLESLEDMANERINASNEMMDKVMS
ncbi:hypothetical protein Tco_0750480 [Tanacetum coccineum]|uniref:Uncharacterized protein n=1 Tax=Tanacetum coccineum TaxID=301880 RepID=A0ABQ4Z1D5_9ASTR